MDHPPPHRLLNELTIRKFGVFFDKIMKHAKVWDLRFQQLAEYKQTHGNCGVPQKYGPSPKLGHWVENQRVAKKKKKLSVEREEKLNAIGFIWKMRNIRQSGEAGGKTGWNARFQQLEEYKNANGDCKVPISYSQNIELGCWVNMQRYKKKNDFLSEEQQRKLNAIGFRWSVNCRVDWNELFRQLLEYKVAFGDCDIPKNSSPSPQQGLWVYRQQ